MAKHVPQKQSKQSKKGNHRRRFELKFEEPPDGIGPLINTQGIRVSLIPVLGE